MIRLETIARESWLPDDFETYIRDLRRVVVYQLEQLLSGIDDDENFDPNREQGSHQRLVACLTFVV